MPCASVTEAVDDMTGLVHAFWEADIVGLGYASPVIFDDNPGARPRETVAGNVVGYGEFGIRHSAGRQAALAADGSARSSWERSGVLTLVTFTPQAQGRTNVDLILQAALDGIEGVHTSNGVWFRNVRIAETGQVGLWYRADILADFEYTQIK